jgi:heme/copper-type cytochrome/quinol oxidase subunit 2
MQRNQNKILVGLTMASIALLTCNAQASISMEEREHVQTIVWVMEAITAVTITTVFWLVWRFSKKAQANRKTKQDTPTD